MGSFPLYNIITFYIIIYYRDQGVRRQFQRRWVAQ